MIYPVKSLWGSGSQANNIFRLVNNMGIELQNQSGNESSYYDEEDATSDKEEGKVGDTKSQDNAESPFEQN